MRPGQVRNAPASSRPFLASLDELRVWLFVRCHVRGCGVCVCVYTKHRGRWGVAHGLTGQGYEEEIKAYSTPDATFDRGLCHTSL